MEFEENKPYSLTSLFDERSNGTNAAMVVCPVAMHGVQPRHGGEHRALREVIVSVLRVLDDEGKERPRVR